MVPAALCTFEEAPDLGSRESNQVHDKELWISAGLIGSRRLNVDCGSDAMAFGMCDRIDVSGF